MGRVRHISFIVGGSREFMRRENVTHEQAYERKFDNVQRVVAACVTRNIPIMTFLLLPMEIRTHSDYPSVVDSLVGFTDSLRKWPLIAERRVKVSVLGHWYNLPGRLVDNIKALMEDTKDHASFHLNLCLNYDGRQEIVDAAKIIGRQVKAGKLDPESITIDTMKESIYWSSAPPNIIVKTGTNNILAGFMLWDSSHASIHITGAPWQYFTEDALEIILRSHESGTS